MPNKPDYALRLAVFAIICVVVITALQHPPSFSNWIEKDSFFNSVLFQSIVIGLGIFGGYLSIKKGNKHALQIKTEEHNRILVTACAALKANLIVIKDTSDETNKTAFEKLATLQQHLKLPAYTNLIWQDHPEYLIGMPDDVVEDISALNTSVFLLNRLVYDPSLGTDLYQTRIDEISKAEDRLFDVICQPNQSHSLRADINKTNPIFQKYATQSKQKIIDDFEVIAVGRWPKTLDLMNSVIAALEYIVAHPQLARYNAISRQ